MTRVPRGNALLGFCVLLGLAATAVISLLLLARLQNPPGLPWLLGALAFTVVASAIALWRSDRVALLQVLLFSTVTPALLAGLWLILSGDWDGALLGVFGVLLLCASGPAYGLWRELHRRVPLPNLLPQFAPGLPILEQHGLQLCLHVTPVKDGALELQVTLQNCMDQERALRLELRSAGPLPS